MRILERTGMDVISPMSEEAVKMYLEGKLNKVKDRRVCACGHPMTYHSEVGDIHVCTPARGRCRCMGSRPVLKASNLRRFMYTTEGVGVAHALGKGIASCRADGSNIEWLDNGPTCDICLENIAEPIPVSVDIAFDKPSGQSTGVDKIVCMGCYTSWISE
jgi:hypothetical protein